MKHEGFDYEFMQRLDLLDTNWYFWSVVRTNLETKEEVEGSIQADHEHELVAWETFEEE